MNIAFGFTNLSQRVYAVLATAILLFAFSAGTAQALAVPVANDDPSYSTSEDAQLVVTAPTGVLVNDTDGDSDPLTATLVADVSNGTLVLNADGSFEYTPDANWNGVDTFTYTADDGIDGASAAATVTITVTAEPDAPVADDDAFSTDVNTALTGQAGLLTGDTDGDGDSLSVVAASGATTEGGTYEVYTDGSFDYTPATDFSGDDTFSYTVTDGADNDSGTVTITVNKLTQTITFGALTAQTYGDDTSLDLVASSDSGLTVSFSVTGSDCAMLDADTVGFTNAGTCTVTALQAGDAEYEAALDVDQTLTINPREITVTAVTDSKTYDTTTSSVGTPTITAGSLAVADAGATFSQEFATEDVGGTITIAASSSLDGDSNYDITYVDATGSITQASLTATADAASKEYDGTTSTTAVVSVTPLAGDTVTATYTTATFDTKDVGTGKTVTVSGIALDGADKDNYVLTSTTATDGADVTAKALTVDVTVADKVYDNTTAGTITGYTPVGLVGVESVTVNGGTATFDTEHVGNGKTVSVTGLNLVADSVSSNYSFTDTDTTTANITQRAITVTAQTDTKVYDGDNLSAVAPVISGLGLASGDTSGFSQEFDDANAGTKTLSIVGSVDDGNSGNNYLVTPVTAVGTITKASVVITADDKTKVYGDANPTATASYDGLVSGEDESVIDTLPTLVITASTHTDVGDAAITVFGAADNNYSFTYENGNLVVTKRPLSVTVDADDKVYDGTTDATVSLTLNGVLFTDVVTVSSTDAEFDTKDVGTGKTVTVSGIALSGADSGNYSIAATETGTADITPATVTVTALPASKVYGDLDPAEFFYISTGLADGDSFTGALTRDSGEDVSDYAIEIGTLDAGSNYDDIVFTSADFSITKAPLTITAEDKSRAYGDANPTLTLVYDGFKFSDDENNLDTAVEGYTAADQFSNVGTYDIDVVEDTGGFGPTSVIEDDNYEITLVSGTLTIFKADQDIYFDPLADMNFGDADFTVSATADSDLAVTFSAAGACTVTGDVVHLTTRGTCTITASQAGDGNWNAATSVDQSFTVNDVENPVITLVGNTDITQVVGAAYVDAGATATDDVDGDLTSSIVVVNPVDVNTVGAYTITYNVTDGSGNVATQVTRTVNIEARRSGGGGSSRGVTDTGEGRVLGAALYFFANDLTIGSTGVDVEELQKILISEGFLKIAAPTGYFGPMTQAAVKLYQAAHGIQATGYVGPLTRAALNAGSAPVTMTVEEQIADLMAKLKALQAQLP